MAPSLVGISASGNPLLLFCLAVLTALGLWFAMNLYRARMKFRRLRARGIVFLSLWSESSYILTLLADIASFYALGPSSHCCPVLPGLGI
jgi:hypothetical protein